MTAFEAKHMSRGTSYDIWHTFIVAGVRDGEQRLYYADVNNLPVSASLTGYYLASLLGQTLLFRLLFAVQTPTERVTFVKHISNTWPGSSPQPMADRYPSMRFDY